jgi:hypothetical protein
MNSAAPLAPRRDLGCRRRGALFDPLNTRPTHRCLEALVHWLLVIAIVVAVYVFVPITG